MASYDARSVSSAGSRLSAAELDAMHPPARRMSFEEAQRLRMTGGGAGGGAGSGASVASYGSGSVASSTCSGNCGGKQCICKMCTCGRHHCPPQRTNTPFHGESTYHHDYPPKSAPRDATRAPIRHTDSYEPSSGPFYGHTTAGDSFKAPPLDTARRSPMKPKQAAPHDSAPFVGNTTAGDAYKYHPVQAPVRATRPADSTVDDSAPFHGTTTTASHYPAHDVQPRRSLKKPVHQTYDAAPFRGETTNAAMYRPPTAEQLAHSAAPGSGQQASSAPGAIQPSGPFYGTTTAAESYKPHDVSPARAIKPKRGQMEPQQHIPFQGSSETRDAYPAHPLPPKVPLQKRGVDWAPEPDSRSFATSAGADYVPKKVERCPVLSLPSKPPDRNIDPRPWKGDHVFYNFHKHTWNHSG